MRENATCLSVSIFKCCNPKSLAASASIVQVSQSQVARCLRLHHSSAVVPSLLLPPPGVAIPSRLLPPSDVASRLLHFRLDRSNLNHIIIASTDQDSDLADAPTNATNSFSIAARSAVPTDKLLAPDLVGLRHRQQASTWSFRLVVVKLSPERT